MKEYSGIICRRLMAGDTWRENCRVHFSGGRITQIRSVEGEPAADMYDATSDDLVVVPGFFDVHVHGSGGCDFLDATAESLQTISASLARGGATSCLATTTIASDDTALDRLTRLVDIIRTVSPTGTRFVGIHLEGPFISRQRRGGFGDRYVRSIDLPTMQHVIDLCGNLLLKVTLAPELESAQELVHLLAKHHVEVSLGHTTADFSMAQRFFQEPNVRQVTHAFNAMEPFHHRAPNLIGAALLDDNVKLEMIPDGHHLAGAAIELLYRMKGPRRIMIVTDGTAATGTPSGTRIDSVGGTNLVSGGAVRLEDGTLAGSSMLMAEAVERARRLAGIPFQDAVTMASTTPAYSVHLENETGQIREGVKADMVVLDANGSVAATIRDGILIFDGRNASGGSVS